MSDQPRSRRQTLAAILGYLLQAGGTFRPPLANAVRLSEASLSRILVDLKSEGLVEEIRHPAPYPGGPTGLVSLNAAVRLGALELTKYTLTVGVGGLNGELHYAERLPLPAVPTSDTIARLFHDALQVLRDWTRRRHADPSLIGVSIPGFGRLSEADNPIVPCDPAQIGRMLDDLFPQVAVEFANAVVAHATYHRCRTPDYPFHGSHLFVIVGQGVAGAWMDDPTTTIAEPVELGHMVFGDGGPRCRCGHVGCVEAYTSLPALARLLGIAEADLLQIGNGWIDSIQITPRLRRELRARLHRLGLAIGNTLNVRPCPGVVIGGWPSLLPEDDRQSLKDGIEASLLGGFERSQVRLAYVAPSSGKDPHVALSFAAASLARRGGMTTSAVEAA